MSAVTQDFSSGAAWMTGRIMPIGEAKISVLDWGLTHSDITYDVATVWDGKFFRLADYLDRFMVSIEKCGLSVEQSREDIRSICHQIVARSGLQKSYVSMVASRGVPLVAGSRDPRQCGNHFYAWCVPFVWVFLEDVIARGAHLRIPQNVERISRHAVDPTAKNYHWGDFTQGLIAAKETGFDNTVLLDGEGYLTEGPGFNLFVIKDGKIRTPRHGVLEGITRRTAIEMCAEQGIACIEDDISFDALMDSDEVFATTSGGGVVPVTRINERVFSNDAPGQITTALSALYWDWHNRPELSEAVDYEACSR